MILFHTTTSCSPCSLDVYRAADKYIVYKYLYIPSSCKNDVTVAAVWYFQLLKIHSIFILIRRRVIRQWHVECGRRTCIVDIYKHAAPSKML